MDIFNTKMETRSDWYSGPGNPGRKAVAVKGGIPLSDVDTTSCAFVVSGRGSALPCPCTARLPRRPPAEPAGKTTCRDVATFAD